jgi:hypothetical protein
VPWLFTDQILRNPSFIHSRNSRCPRRVVGIVNTQSRFLRQVWHEFLQGIYSNFSTSIPWPRMRCFNRGRR